VRACADVDIGVVGVQTGHKLKPLDSIARSAADTTDSDAVESSDSTASSLLACEHCMVADCALQDVWVSLVISL